jgi:AAA domain
MEVLIKNDPPVDLLGSQSPSAIAFQGSQLSSAMFHSPGTAPEFSNLPISLDRTRIGTKMTFQIMGSPVATRIVLDIKIGGANISKKHETRLEFYHGMSGQVSNLVFEEVPFEKGEVKDTPAGFLVKWSTVGGIGTGLGLDLPSFDPETRATLDHMRSLSHDTGEHQRSVQVFVLHTGSLVESSKNVQGTETASIPWGHYYDKTLSATCTISGMQSRAGVNKATGGLIRYPSKNSFASITEAYIMLANGTLLEYRQEPCKPPRHHWPGMEKSDFFLQQQLTALHRVCTSSGNRQICSVWWPLILNQRPDLLPITHPAKESGLGSDLADTNLLRILESFTWTEEQNSVLEKSDEFHGPAKIIRGPPGSGKTQVVAGVALFHALAGQSVLVCAPTAPSAKAFASALEKLRASKSIADGGNNFEVITMFAFEPDFEELKTNSLLPDVTHARVLITTPSFVCSKILCSQFGASSSGIIVVHEDSYLIPDSELLATIFALDEYNKVRGLVLTSDVREWPMDIASQTDPIRQIKLKDEKRRQSLSNLFFRHYYDERKDRKFDPDGLKRSGVISFIYGRNEFADQIGLALVTRLVRQNFPNTKLENQYRLHDSLLAFPSERAYGCKSFSLSRQLGQHGAVQKFQKLLQVWLKDDSIGALTKVFIDASDGSPRKLCVKAYNMTESKSNARNVEVVMDLLRNNRDLAAVDPADVTIITQYADQLRAYEKKFEEVKELQESLGLEASPFPRVTTLDSMRGHQSPVVIYDMVVTCGDASHGIGIVAEEYRANIAATRATDVFVIVGSEEILTKFPAFWRALMLFNDSKQPLPYIVSYIQQLQRDDCYFRAPTRDSKPADYLPPPKYWKPKEQGDFQGGWEKTAHYIANYDPGMGQ